jgi:molecular chaperone GrpE
MSEENKEQQKEEIKDTQATAANQEPSAQKADSSEKPETEQRQSRRERRKHREHHDDNEQKVQELGQKLIEANDKYVRIYSEYENYRKRTTMEKADLILNGAKDTIKAILPVVDDFERALAHIADDDASKEGVQLIYNKMMKVLEQRGLKPMEAKGQKFDENLHEAVTQFPAADESQKGMVVDVIEKGYYLNDKVLRYAKVVVAI